MPNRRDIPNWAFQPLRLMVLLVILAAVFAATSGCKEYYAKEAEDSVPTVTVVGTFDGCKVTKEVWTSKRGNVVAESFYFEKDGYVLRLYDPKNKDRKRSFRMGMADVPKPDDHRFISGVFSEKPIPKELLFDELSQAVDKVTGFEASLSASTAEIVAATTPWVGDALQDISTYSFEPVAQVGPDIWLNYGSVSTDKGTAYVFDGPWWLASWIVLERDGFTIYIDTRGYDVYEGAYTPNEGTAVIRGKYGGEVKGGRIEGTELSDYRTGLLRESTIELETLVPFASSKLYPVPKDMAKRCDLAAKTLRAAGKLTWDASVPESIMLRAPNTWVRMVLDEREWLTGNDLNRRYLLHTDFADSETAELFLHENGTLKVEFDLGTYNHSDDFSYFVTDGRASVLYQAVDPGTSLTKQQLAGLVSFNAAVNAGLIEIPLRYTAAYEHFKELIADPTLPKGRKAVDFEKIAQDLLDELQ